MAKKEKKGNGKKTTGGIITLILVPILITVLIGCFLFAIFDAIIGFIKRIVLNFVESALEFLAHPIKWTVKKWFEIKTFVTSKTNGEFDPSGFEKYQPKQLIEISQEEFENMRNAIDKSVGRDTVGLDDMMLKKMLLAFNTGKYSKNADIILQLTEEEAKELKKDQTQPFEIKQGKSIDQISMNYTDEILNEIKKVFNVETNPNADKQDNYYLCAKGVLTFLNEDGEELIYYHEEVLKKLYELYDENKDWENRDFAESVWKYLSGKCYTDGIKGMQIYAHETIKEEVVEWEFSDNTMGVVDIGKLLIDERFITRNEKGGILQIVQKTRKLQDIDYYSLVSEYSTPVELMVNLLNISSSKEFLNAFIDKFTSQTSVTLKLYKTRDSYRKEITEKTEETTTVDLEAVVTAKVTHIETDGDGDLTYEEGSAGIVVDVDLVEGGILGIKDNVTAKFTLKNVPAGVRAIKIHIEFTEDGNIFSTDTKEIVSVGEDIKNVEDKLTFEKTYWISRYKQKWNSGKIEKVTTKATTETKLDIAVEEVKTWYGYKKYTNNIRTNIMYETEDENSIRKSIGSQFEKISLSKPVQVTTKTRESDNAKAIFSTSKSFDKYVGEEIWANVESSYADLTSDQVLYNVTGGFVTHNIYEALQKDRGYQLGTEEELLNIRFIAAMENGAGDAWVKGRYTPIKVTYSETSREESVLYTTIRKHVIKGVENSQDNTDFFLSLLKNSTGKYSRDEVYDPNGEHVVYKTIYGTETKVGKFLVNRFRDVV